MVIFARKGRFCPYFCGLEPAQPGARAGEGPAPAPAGDAPGPKRLDGPGAKELLDRVQALPGLRDHRVLDRRCAEGSALEGSLRSRHGCHVEVNGAFDELRKQFLEES